MNMQRGPLGDEHPTRPIQQQEQTVHETAVFHDGAPRLAPDADRSWRHPVNTGHLVMGVAFAGILGVWALFASEIVAAEDLRWLTPLPWVLAGAAGLAAATWTNLRNRRERDAHL